MIGRIGTVAAIRVKVRTRTPRKITVRVSEIAKHISAISARHTNTDMRMELAVTSNWARRSSGDSTASHLSRFLLSQFSSRQVGAVQRKSRVTNAGSQTHQKG